MKSLLKVQTVAFFHFVIFASIFVFSLFNLSGCSGGGDSPPPAAPKILTQPSNQSVRAGEAASFSVVASGEGTLAYQWKRNGADVAGANGVTYAISSPQLPDTTSVWSVAVSNAGGSVTSAGATLTVKPALGISLLAGTLNIPGNADGVRTNAGFSSPRGLAVDKAGNVYVVDGGNATIRKISPVGAVTTLAGVAGAKGSADGVGAAARFTDPQQIAIDKEGNLYVADNNTVRKILPNGTVSTLAGVAGSAGSVNGIGAEARFDNIYGITVDVAGNVFVTEPRQFTIRKISPSGVVSVYDKVNSFNYYCIAADNLDNLYLSWYAPIGGFILTLTPRFGRIAPDGSDIFGYGGYDNLIGRGSTALQPVATTVDSANDAFAVSAGAENVIKVSQAGKLTTIVGTGGVVSGALDNPAGIAVNSDGLIYVSTAHAVMQIQRP